MNEAEKSEYMARIQAGALHAQEQMRKFTEGARKKGEEEAAVRAITIASLASEVYERLGKLIAQFDAALDEAEEVAVRLVSFGQSVTFHVESIGYYNPSLITFVGRTGDGPVTLVQHVSQLSFLLTSVKRANPSEPKKPFGFAEMASDPLE